MVLKALRTWLLNGYFYPCKWKLEYVELKVKKVIKEVGNLK